MQFLNADLIFLRQKKSYRNPVYPVWKKQINIVTVINHISLWLSSVSLAIPRPGYCQAC